MDQHHRHTRRVLRALLSLLLSGALPVSLAAPPLPQPAIPALVELKLNGVEFGVQNLMHGADGRWYATEAQFGDWRVKAVRGAPLVVDGVNWYPLDAFPDTKIDFDASDQSLKVDIGANAFRRTRVLDYQAGRQKTMAPTVSPGAFLNYALDWNEAAGVRQLGGFFEAAGFGAWGSLTSTFSATGLLGIAAPKAPRNRFHRLETQWRRDDLQAARSLIVGDSLSDGGLLGGAVRFGGIQWRSEFSMRPNFVRFQRPSFAGEAVVPSVLELYVDGQLRGRSQVPAGPFEIPPVPFLNGRGEASIVVRDLLGRQQVITQAFNATQVLLKPGVREFSWELGATRRQYGVQDFRYGKLFVSGLERRGWTNTLTSEFKFEANRQRWMAGGALSLAVGAPLLLTAGVLASGGKGGRGERSILNADLGLPGRTTLRISTRRTHGSFRQPASESTAAPGGYQSSATLSVPFKGAGSVSLSLVKQDSGNGPVRIGSIGYSVPLPGSANLSLSMSRTESDRVSSSLFAFLSIPFGERGTLSSSLSRTDGLQSLTATASVRASHDGGWSYRVATNRNGARDRLDAGASYRGDDFETALSAAFSTGDPVLRADLRGAFARIDGGWHRSRTVHDGFALVRAKGLPGVPVYLNNLRQRDTDATGVALVTPLQAYVGARVSLGTDTLPIDQSVEPSEQIVVAGYRSGVLADFTLVRELGMLLLVRLADGKPLPTAAIVKMEGESEETLSGFDGKVYFPAVRLPARFLAKWARGSCGFAMDEVSEEARARAATGGLEVTCTAH